MKLACTGFPDFLKSEKVYRPDEIKDVLKLVRHDFRFAYSNKKLRYFNVPCSFDIETSSFYEDETEDFMIDTEPYYYLKGLRIKIPENAKSEIQDYNNIRKKYFGIIILSSNSGTPVDSIYNELTSVFPYWFPDDLINPIDQIQKIFEVIDNTRPDNTEKGRKTAIMYCWQFGIFGVCIMGRTWDEFVSMLDTLSKELDLNHYKRLIVYCHNLEWEFQFMRKWLLWSKVFSISNRKPCYALTTNGIEFRCSYILSGYSLKKVGEELRTYTYVYKTDGLDYSLLRHNKTPLTKDEILYCINDIRVVMGYIAEQCDIEGDIGRIPLTKTGYVRRYCKNACFYTPGVPRNKDFKRLRYRELIKNLTLDSDEYKQLKRAFQGGFTHGNPFKVNKVLENVTSYDFTSSYPAVMIAEQFPMSKGEIVEITSKEQLNDYLNLYWCVFDIEFEDLEPRVRFENYISISRCWDVSLPLVNNGRIYKAKHINTTITGEDYRIIERMYKWSNARIYNFRRYYKDYLPTDFVKSILKLYQDKTKLKGVPGMELEYLSSKQNINSCFGMCVTDNISKPEIVYKGGEWSFEMPDIGENIKKYNRNAGRFLFYPWGVAITSYARRNLFSGILEFGDDYIYSDTDSLKVLNAEKHMEYINGYNEWITKRLERAMKYHGLNPEDIRPKTIEGKEKPLGVWDYEGLYSRFKFLGAKRYVVEHDGEISLTVSGLNKKTAVPYLLKKYGHEKVFDHFTNKMKIPGKYSGTKTHTYLDFEQIGQVTDYLGNTADYYEQSSIHLSEQDYSLSISKEFADFITGLT